MAVSRDDYRRTIGLFATGVTIITSTSDGKPRGLTANAVASVSLDPVQLLVCIERTAQTRAALVASGVFAVNILASDQEHLSRLFATPGGASSSQLEGVAHTTGKLGLPILDGIIACLECRVTETYPGGDHDIFIGQVEAMNILRPDAAPLVFYGGKYGNFVPFDRTTPASTDNAVENEKRLVT